MDKTNPLIRMIGLILILGILSIGLSGCTVFYFNWNADSMTTAPSTGGSTTGQPGTTSPIDNLIVWTGKIISIESERSFLAAVDSTFQSLLGDKAQVSLYDNAKVIRNETGEEISLPDVPIGSRVIVKITGAIRESYPVQVSAVEVRVIGSKN